LINSIVYANPRRDVGCRYSDEPRWSTARFSNTSDFMLGEKYSALEWALSHGGLFHEKDGSFDGSYPGASERRINLFLR
jgi:hypothetical protein